MNTRTETSKYSLTNNPHFPTQEKNTSNLNDFTDISELSVFMGDQNFRDRVHEAFDEANKKHEYVFIFKDCSETNPCQHLLIVQTENMTFANIMSSHAIYEFLEKNELAMPEHFLNNKQ